MKEIMKMNEKFPELAKKCADINRTKKYVNEYHKYATTVVENTVYMAKTLYEVSCAVKEESLSEYDLNYFCQSVGLNKMSSQYRKLICIGKNANRFESYITKMPDAISVLYEITTLNPRMFEFLVENNHITPNLTLSSLKKLTGKTPVSSSQGSTNNSISKPTIALKFDIEKISKESAIVLIEFYEKFESCFDIEIECIEWNEIRNKIESITKKFEVIDVKSKMISE